MLCSIKNLPLNMKRCALFLACALLAAVPKTNSAEATVETIGGAFAGYVDGDNNVSQFNTPSALALDGAGNLYIADTQNNALRVMELNSTRVRTLAQVAQISGLAFDSSTNLLYVSSQSLGTVTRYDKLGNPRGSVLTGLVQPTAMASDTNGNMYVAELSGRVRRFATNGTVTGTYQVSTGAPRIRGVAVLSGSRVVVSDAGNHVLWQFASPGTAPAVYAGIIGSPGFAEGFWNSARFNTPQQIATGPNDSIIVADRFNHRVRMVSCDRVVQTLFGIDPSQWETFPDPSVFPGWFDGTTQFAESREPVGIAVSEGGTVYDTEIFYHLVREGTGFTFPSCTGGGGPTTNAVPTPILSPTSGFFENGVQISVTASNLTATFPDDVRLYYTIDGVTPNQSSPQIPIINGRGELFLTGPVDLGNLRIIAIDSLGNTSPVIAGLPTEGVNLITLGFEQGPASSDFVGTPGQRFVAPVTLSIVPGTKMYGLQFSLKVDAQENTNQVDGDTLQFDSMLARPSPNEPGVFYIIPNAVYSGTATPAGAPTEVDTDNGRYIVTLPVSIPPSFTSMLFRDPANRTLGAGWWELPPMTNLYNTRQHDLIRYSFAHSTLFESPGGKIVTGGFSFQVPTAAKIGDRYTVQVGRPSATGNASGSDPVIVAPGANYPGADKAKGIRTLTVGIREYIVGDIMPFRWYNAGDFGDGSILNNDISQMQAAIVYNLGVPPQGSDFEGAYDSCCVGTNGFNYGDTFNPFFVSQDVLNSIGFGDGRLTIADMYLSYWRGLDPNLVWYARFWSNGVLNAKVVDNEFRGGSGFSTLSTRQSAGVESDQPNSDPLGIKLEVKGAFAQAGQVLDVPVRISISGGLPVRSIMFQARIKRVDGVESVTEPLEFLPSPDLGAPSFANSDTPAIFGGVWMDTARTAVRGDAILGTLRVKIPADASSSSAWSITLEDVSASPNGIYHFPVETKGGIVIMNNRPVNWGDEIPNAWREKYFTSPISYDARLDGDPDGDGADNRAEYRSGTSPVNGADALKVRASAQASGGVRLSWPTVAGKRYILEASSDLVNGPWQVLGEVRDGTGSELQSSDNATGPRFYRIRLAE